MIARRALLATTAAAGLIRPARAETKLVWRSPAAHFYMAPCFATDHDLWAKHGLPPIDFGLSQAPPTLLPAVQAGAIQVGASTAINVALARENGLDIKLLSGASIQIRGNPGTAILAAPDSTLSQPADFVGKKLVTPGVNGSFHVMFEKWMLDAGQDPKKVTYLEAGFANAGDFLRNRSADAVLSAEPFMSRLIAQGLAKKVAEYFQPRGENSFDAFYIVRGDWAAENPKYIAAFRALLNDALAQMRADPKAAYATEAKWLNLPPDAAANTGVIAPRCDFAEDEIQDWISIATQVGLITQPLKAKDMIA